MDDPESVAQFHTGGASNPGMRAVYDLCARALDALLPPCGRLLDLGVGSGRALSAVLRRRPDVQVTAVDLAPNMLSTARELFDAEGLGERVELLRADITALPGRISTGPWDAISCMWTLHQLPDFDALRGALGQIAAVQRRSAAAVWISDFQRLRDPTACPTCWCAPTPPRQLSCAKVQLQARRRRSPSRSYRKSLPQLDCKKCTAAIRHPYPTCRRTGCSVRAANRTL